VAMSGVNISDALFSLMAIFLIGNPRSGIAVYINNLLNGLNFSQLIFFIFVSITAVSIALFLSLKLGDVTIEHVQKLNYKKLTWTVIIFMSSLVLIFTISEHENLLLVLISYFTSITLGLLPHFTGINKSNLMGVLIVPAIVVYLGLAT
jgi:putative membrane protein